MKKVDSWKDIVVGRVYNRVYVGPNEAYAKINGKETFRVVATSPQLEVQVLFSQFGSLFSEEFESNMITFGYPDIAFKEFELYEPADESEWFKKSVRCSSIGEALERGLLTAEDVSNKCFDTGRFIPCHSGVEFLGVYGRFSVEGKTKFPVLQAVFVHWKDWKELRAELGKYGTTVLN